MSCRPENWDTIRDRLIEENCMQIRNAIPLCYPLVEAVAGVMYKWLKEISLPKGKYYPSQSWPLPSNLILKGE